MLSIRRKLALQDWQSHKTSLPKYLDDSIVRSGQVYGHLDFTKEKLMCVILDMDKEEDPKLSEIVI